MEQTMRNAPAKVNLALDILGRRPDGYHEMRMVMQSISLGDLVEAEEQESGFLLDAGDLIPAGKKSLEQQAAEAFFAAIGRPMPGLCVHLTKRVPAYAGLGGGSGDVAALLRILRETYAPEMSTEELERIGLQVGSDMPFCIHGGTARAEGRGERLTDLPPLPDCCLVLCKPDFGIPTGELFAKVRPEAFTRRPDLAGMEQALAAGDLDGVVSRLCNVFEELLGPEHREVFVIEERLRDLGALNAVMSGSGPTVFGIFPGEDAAKQAVEVLKREYAQTFLAYPLKKFD